MALYAEHPLYTKNARKWQRWRLAYEAGDEFIERYLYSLSVRETLDDLQDRKTMAYVPAFATAAVDDVKNSIFQRIADVTRVGGPESYMQAVKGLAHGVDYQDSTIGTYIGTNVLPELLVLGRVGVLVDNFADLGNTFADKEDKHPFLDICCCEDILSWAPTNPVHGFTKLLIRTLATTENDYGLPCGTEYEYRLFEKLENNVRVTFYNSAQSETKQIILNVRHIPFVLLSLPRSLMENIDRYQIALMNLESSDIAFARKANYPFYYEFTDDRNAAFGKGPGQPGDDGTQPTSKKREVAAGLSVGRQFPKGVDPPGFINPDPETLRISMEKGAQLKEDIRLLINLNLQSMDPRRQSSDSKTKDSEGLEAGLSFIGLVLERGEREIARHWSAFEGSKEIAEITYPKTYKLKTDADRRTEATELEKLLTKIPSETYRRETLKKMATILLGSDVPENKRREIYEQIDASKTSTTDPNLILSAHKSGLIDDELAAITLGFPKETVQQAKKDRAERIKLTMEAQGGVNDADPNRGAPEFDKGVPQDDKGAGRGAADNTEVS